MRALFAILSIATAAALTVPAHAHLLNDLDYPYSIEDIRDGAQLRSEAAIVIPIVFSPCAHSPAMDPVLERYAAFLEKLTLTRQRIDMDIALADFDYQMSLVDIACLPTGSPQLLEQEELQIAMANNVLQRMEVLVEQTAEKQSEQDG